MLLPEVLGVDVAETSLVAAEVAAIADFAEDSADPYYEGGTPTVPAVWVPAAGVQLLVKGREAVQPPHSLAPFVASFGLSSCQCFGHLEPALPIQIWSWTCRSAAYLLQGPSSDEKSVLQEWASAMPLLYWVAVEVCYANSAWECC